MKIVKWGGYVYTFRWPWRVVVERSGFHATFPRWGELYRWVCRLIGYQLFTTKKLKEDAVPPRQ